MFLLHCLLLLKVQCSVYINVNGICVAHQFFDCDYSLFTYVATHIGKYCIFHSFTYNIIMNIFL